MPTYKTPGVYVEEIPTLPPSVAEVSTAIPAFIGYTEKGAEIARVSTLLEYEELFGGACPATFSVTANGGPIEDVARTGPDFLLHYCLRHYFSNGGGACYVVSIGDHSQTPTQDRFLDGLARLEREDEPTLILLPDAVLLDADSYYTVCQAALAQCNKLGDRFAILDVRREDAAATAVQTFRDKIGTNSLMYGAAYHPYVQTTLSYRYREEEVSVMLADPAAGEVNLQSLKDSKTALYSEIQAALAGERVVLPPSAAVAGIYASVDRDRGVWKAPANVSLSAVIGPVEKITHEDQESLNIDPDGGKSINAIRAFTGKGTLVWGARTLAGNDNEWRYVPVRRLFNMIEESSNKATAFAVFEANDATTWLKVKGMIESYLYGLWEQGAFAGATPEEAYFVNVGLGTTMTPQDVLEGRMIVEIGAAAVRMAEFIVLRFSHKMQEA